jgi:acyl-CoA thioesterase
MDIDLEKIRAFFTRDRFAANAGIVIDSVTEDEVRCSMPITPEHRNAGGGVQGGAIFTLADLAFAVHSNLRLFAGEKVGITVGQSNSISYLAAAKGKKLIARSTCLSRGRNVSVFRVEVRDESGNFVADMRGNGFTKESSINNIVDSALMNLSRHGEHGDTENTEGNQ